MPRTISKKRKAPSGKGEKDPVDRSELESLYQEQNKRFQVICSSKNDAIITSDESKMILFWNRGAEHIFGYSPDEAIGRPMTLIIPGELHLKKGRFNQDVSNYISTSIDRVMFDNKFVNSS